MTHSHYLHGIQENDKRKAEELAEFNRMWQIGERHEKIDVHASFKPADDMVVACSGGGYLPRGLRVEEEKG